MKVILEENDDYIIYIDKNYLVLTKAIKCKKCGMTSYDENDVNLKYCGNCDKFHSFEKNKKSIEN